MTSNQLPSSDRWAAALPPPVSPQAPHLALGRRGEQLVADRLTALGWRILARNWRCPRGEIDIIAIDPANRELVIVEVKTRGGTGFGTGAQAVTVDKLRRLRHLAAEWLTEHRPEVRGVRIDVAAVLAPPGREPSIDIVRGAFR